MPELTSVTFLGGEGGTLFGEVVLKLFALLEQGGVLLHRVGLNRIDYRDGREI